MKTFQRPIDQRRKHRDGMATVEFVMVLPVLVLVLALLIQIGVSLSKQSETIVAARHDAWQRRSTPGSTPFEFSTGNDGAQTASASEGVAILRIFENLPPSQSSHTVATDSWGSSSVDLNRQPNLRRIFDLARRGPRAELKGQVGDLRRLQSKLDDIGSLDDLLGDAGGVLSGLGADDIADMASSLGGMGSGADELISSELADALRQNLGNITDDVGILNEIKKLESLLGGERDNIEQARRQAEAESQAQRDAAITDLEGASDEITNDELTGLQNDIAGLESAESEDLSTQEGQDAVEQALQQLESGVAEVAASMRAARDALEDVELDEATSGRFLSKTHEELLRRQSLAELDQLTSEIDGLKNEIRELLNEDEVDADEVQTKLEELQGKATALRGKAREWQQGLDGFLQLLRM